MTHRTLAGAHTLVVGSDGLGHGVFGQLRPSREVVGDGHAHALDAVLLFEGAVDVAGG